MREEIESRTPPADGPATSPMDSHEVRERHFHWPETERTRAAWVDWEWRAWGVAQRTRAAARRAWRSLTTRDHVHHMAGDGDDHPTHPSPAAVDEPRAPQP